MARAELAEPTTQPRAPRRQAPSHRSRVLLAVALLGGGSVIYEAIRVLFGANFHAVIPGRVYRSAQPSDAAVERAVHGHGVRTVINLRGTCTALSWYLEEARATHRHDVCQEDVCFSAGRLPSRTEMRRLIEVLDHCEYPVLLHCRRGADRTGLAAAVVMLLQTDATLAQASRQLGVRYGHVGIGRPAYLGQFLDLYEEWLSAAGQEHSRASFRRWVLEDYRAGPCSARIELLTPSPIRAPRGVPFAVRVRAHNTGVRPWRFRPLEHAGVHCGFHVWNAKDVVAARGRAGLFDAAVAPGESIELTLVVGAIREPGRYRLVVDLIEEQHCWFFQGGSEPLEEEIVVP